MPILCEVSKFPLHAVCSHHKVDISNFAVYVGQCYSFFFFFFFSPLMKKRTFSNMQLCNYWLLVADKTSVVTFLWCRLHIYCAFFFYFIFLKTTTTKTNKQKPLVAKTAPANNMGNQMKQFLEEQYGLIHPTRLHQRCSHLLIPCSLPCPFPKPATFLLLHLHYSKTTTFRSKKPF